MGKYLCEEDMNTGEYISRDEALKIFHQCCDNCTNSYNGVMCRACADADAMDILIDMPATEVQPVKRGKWIEKSKDYYKQWQDSGRSYDDMPYFVTGLVFACSNCFKQFDVNAEGVEEWTGCPCCLARMDGDENDD